VNPVDRCPVVVIGGGIVGCAIALYLVDRGTNLVLVDADHPGDSASAVSFASISAFDKDPVDYYTLACAGMNSWSRFAGRLGGDVGYRRGGQIRWTAGPGDDAWLAERVARAQAWGYPIQLVSERQLRDLLPAAEPGPVGMAAHAARDAHVDPPAVLAACHAVLREAGARLLLGARAAVRVVNDGVRVQVGDETLSPSVTVLATGAGSVAMAAPFGLDIPLVPSPGMLVVTTPTAPLTPGVVYLPGDPGPPVHLRHRADSAVLIGQRSQEEVATDLSGRHARAMVAQAARFFPTLGASRVERVQVGWRSLPADRLPIVGPVPGEPSLYLAVTHSGVTLAPALGRLVARELLDHVEEPLLTPFRPGRFSARAARALLDVEQAFQAMS